MSPSNIVYLPWLRAVEQPVKTWLVLGWVEWQREHIELTIIFQRARLKGIGNVSQPAHNKKESCFSGKPYINIFSTGDSFAPEQLYPEIYSVQSMIEK